MADGGGLWPRYSASASARSTGRSASSACDERRAGCRAQRVWLDQRVAEQPLHDRAAECEDPADNNESSYNYPECYYYEEVDNDSDTFTDWPADVSVLLNKLGGERFAVLGYSMGGPYALAAARALLGRVERNA